MVQQATPKQGNERLLGFDQLNDPLQRAESARAQNSGHLTLAGPVELVQGGLGVVGSQPVFTKDGHGQEKFWDSTFVTIRLHSVLAAAHLTQLGERGYHYRLRRMNPATGQEQTIASPPPTPGADAVSRSLTLPNGLWTLDVVPSQGWGARDILILRCALGLLFAVLMAFPGRLLIRLREHDQGLAQQITQRTSEIQTAQQQLRAIVDAIPAPLEPLKA